jgi:hypothetical protein
MNESEALEFKIDHTNQGIGFAKGLHCRALAPTGGMVVWLWNVVVKQGRPKLTLKIDAS